MTLRPLLPLIAGVAIVCGDARIARADDTAGIAWSNDRLFVPRTDIALTVGLGAFIFGTEVWQTELAPIGCRWCERNALDEGVRGALRLRTLRREADALSGIVAYGALPAFSMGGLALAAEASQDGPRRHGSENALMVLQPALVTTAIAEAAKFLVARERPLVRDASADAAPWSEANLSFFSGHTALSFSLASSAGTVAALRGYKSEPIFWGVGLGLAAFVGYLRIAADKHYFTDVLVGALLGTAAGMVVPRLLHPRMDGGAGFY